MDFAVVLPVKTFSGVVEALVVEVVEGVVVDVVVLEDTVVEVAVVAVVVEVVEIGVVGDISRANPAAALLMSLLNDKIIVSSTTFMTLVLPSRSLPHNSWSAYLGPRSSINK